MSPLGSNYHAVRWNEPLIMEMGNVGERGIPPAGVEDEIVAEVGDVASTIPPSMKRKEPPALPDRSQPPRSCGTTCACLRCAWVPM